MSASGRARFRGYDDDEYEDDTVVAAGSGDVKENIPGSGAGENEKKMDDVDSIVSSGAGGGDAIAVIVLYCIDISSGSRGCLVAVVVVISCFFLVFWSLFFPLPFFFPSFLPSFLTFSLTLPSMPFRCLFWWISFFSLLAFLDISRKSLSHSLFSGGT